MLFDNPSGAPRFKIMLMAGMIKTLTISEISG
jgi:hypothetical protein